MADIIKVEHLSYVYNPGMPNAVTVQASIALLRERVKGRPVLLATHDRAAIDALGWPMLELQKLAQPGAACNSTNKGLQ